MTMVLGQFLTLKFLYNFKTLFVFSMHVFNVLLCFVQGYSTFEANHMIWNLDYNV
jgi:hypothetical protein